MANIYSNRSFKRGEYTDAKGQSGYLQGGALKGAIGKATDENCANQQDSELYSNLQVLLNSQLRSMHHIESFAGKLFGPHEEEDNESKEFQYGSNISGFVERARRQSESIERCLETLDASI